MFYFFCILIFLYYWYGLSYSKGCSEYAKENYYMPNQNKLLQSVLKKELLKFINTAKSFSFLGIFLGFFDVVHSLIVLAMYNIMPRILYCNFIIWLFIFPLALPSCIKSAHRYNKYGCIRNHSKKNNDHICTLILYTR